MYVPFLAAFSPRCSSAQFRTLALVVSRAVGQFAVFARGATASPHGLSLAFASSDRSAWRYASARCIWWSMIASRSDVLPFAPASLELFNMLNTYYGDLKGHFVGSGPAAVLRGVCFGRSCVVPLPARHDVRLGEVELERAGRRAESCGDDRRAGRGGYNIGSSASSRSSASPGRFICGGAALSRFQAMCCGWWIGTARLGR